MTPPHGEGPYPEGPAPARPARSDGSAARRQLDRYISALVLLWPAVAVARLTCNILGVNREAPRAAQLAARIAPEAACPESDPPRLPGRPGGGKAEQANV
jgi:hypothetical protein